MDDRGRMSLVRVVAHVRHGEWSAIAPANRRWRTPLQAKLSMLRMEFNRASRKLFGRCEQALAAAEVVLRQLFGRAR